MNHLQEPKVIVAVGDIVMANDEIRAKFPNLGAKIIAKIESPVGVSNIQSILAKSDGIMLCRGDLSSFYDEEEMFSIGSIMSNLREDESATLSWTEKIRACRINLSY